MNNAKTDKVPVNEAAEIILKINIDVPGNAAIKITVKYILTTKKRVLHLL